MTNDSDQSEWSKGKRDPAKTAMRKEFAKRLYSLMISKGWSQSDLARSSGLKRAAISTYIKGTSFPTDENLTALVKALGCDVTDLQPDFIMTPAEEAFFIEARAVSFNKKLMHIRINQIVKASTAAEIIHLVTADEYATSSDAEDRLSRSAKSTRINFGTDRLTRDNGSDD